MNTYFTSTRVRWFAAELLGTLILATTVGVGMVGKYQYAGTFQALYLPLLVGLVVAVLVYVFGSISGAHFNPAVTISLWVGRKINTDQLAINVLAQLMGAFLGIKFATYLMGSVPAPTLANNVPALVGEFAGAFFLLLAIASVVVGAIDASAAGMVIGLALAVGISVALIPSGGILNPALSLFLDKINLGYVIAPIMGGLVATTLVLWLHKDTSNLQ